MEKNDKRILGILGILGYLAVVVGCVAKASEQPETELKMPRSESVVFMETADAEYLAMDHDIFEDVPDEEAPLAAEPELIESIDLICLCAYTEAGNQPEEGIRAVVDVIKNRVNHPAYPDTAEAVILQPSQFAIRQLTVPEEFREIVIDEWNTETPILDSEYVYFNTVPHKFGHDYIQIGGHWFGKY